MLLMHGFSKDSTIDALDFPAQGARLWRRLQQSGIEFAAETADHLCFFGACRL